MCVRREIAKGRRGGELGEIGQGDERGRSESESKGRVVIRDILYSKDYVCGVGG